MKRVYILFFTVMLLHLLLCPFTKVEESFSVQALHDLSFEESIVDYDHFSFPGVVPRSFVPVAILHLISLPLFIPLKMFWRQNFAFISLSKPFFLYLYRALLGCLVASSYIFFAKSFARKVKLETSEFWVLCISACQFHTMFYMSRPLCNIFALCTFLFAVSFWLQNKFSAFVWTSAFTVIVLRAELLIFLSIFALHSLLLRKNSFLNFLKSAISSGLFFLSLTVCVDSYFWQRLTWPEGEVLWYNLVLNKSSNWGTSPFLWYFYSALPRSLLSSIFFLPVTLFFSFKNKTVFRILCFSLLYVFSYSFLPHKELRFVIYAIPLLNAAIGYACSYLWTYHSFIIRASIITHISFNTVSSLYMLRVSSLNYPGAKALLELHALHSHQQSLNHSVHIDTLACETGVTKFHFVNENWRYHRNESLSFERKSIFTLLITDANAFLEIPQHSQFTLLKEVSSFYKINLPTSPFQFIREFLSQKIIILKPTLFLWKKKEEKDGEKKDSLLK